MKTLEENRAELRSILRKQISALRRVEYHISRNQLLDAEQAADEFGLIAAGARNVVKAYRAQWHHACNAIIAAPKQRVAV